MKPATQTGNPPQICPDCGDRYWSWGAHAERCYGRPREQPCECPPGMQHRPDCHVVTGKTVA